MLTMKNLENVFEAAEKNQNKYIGVKIEMKGFSQPEVIINPIENFHEKLAYYQKAYDEELNLKAAKGIKIVGIANGDNYAFIETALA